MIIVVFGIFWALLLVIPYNSCYLPDILVARKNGFVYQGKNGVCQSSDRCTSRTDIFHNKAKNPAIFKVFSSLSLSLSLLSFLLWALIYITIYFGEALTCWELVINGSLAPFYSGIISRSIWRKCSEDNNENGDSSTWFGVQQRVLWALVYLENIFCTVTAVYAHATYYRKFYEPNTWFFMLCWQFTGELQERLFDWFR